MKDKKIIPDKKSGIHERFATDFLSRAFKSFESLTKSKYHRDIMDKYYKKEDEKKQESSEASYMYLNGRTDDLEGAITSCRCFAKVLGKILKEKEGMVVELPYQEKYPDDLHGKYIVFREGGLIKIDKCSIDEEHFEDGQWLWLDLDKVKRLHS